MKPRIKLITLAVDDLDRALRFYRDGLGLKTKGITGQQFEHGSVVDIELEGGLILALWPASSLSKDANIVATSNRLGAISLGHIVNSRDEVDALVQRAVDAGATVTDAARDRFWGGYSAHLHDPDGHLWEIAWNPQFSDQTER
jgi:uncharacterized protein